MDARFGADCEERRQRVARLLREGSDLKRLRSSTETAGERIREAYELANREPKLLPPWPALAAYRLAHIVFRTAREAQQLENTEQLFLEAARVPELGPLPHIYRLAVLHRLRSRRWEVDIDTRIRRGFEKAQSKLRESLVTRPDETEVVPTDPQLQHGLFNALELCAYFLGLDYTPLEGSGGPYADLYTDHLSWFLVGPNPAIATVEYPRELALAELEARGREVPGAVLFRLPGDLRLAAWKRPGGDWQRTSHRHARLLACMLDGRSRDMRRFRWQVVGNSDRETSLRQYVLRVRTGLSRLTGRPRGDIVVQEAGCPPCLAPDLAVYGAVDRGTYNTPARSL